MPERGLFIAIEGGDGSGKGTQTTKLVERARNEGVEVMQFTFPRYEQASARYVTRYLNGEYGEANEVHPDLASLPFVLDRVVAAEQLRKFLYVPTPSLASTCRLGATDRYTDSNCAHQGTKIDSFEERKRFYQEIRELEYEILGLPKPDMVFTLLVPTDIAQSNVDKKSARSYTTLKRDIHEKDSSHLDKAKRNYQELMELYPDDHTAIDCIEDGKMRSIEDIHEELWALTLKLLERGPGDC